MKSYFSSISEYALSPSCVPVFEVGTGTVMEDPKRPGFPGDIPMKGSHLSKEVHRQYSTYQLYEEEK